MVVKQIENFGALLFVFSKVVFDELFIFFRATALDKAAANEKI
jgi:hypothetical protein